MRPPRRDLARPSPKDNAEFSANAEIAACLQKLTTNISTDYEWPSYCHSLKRESSGGSNVTFKIEKHRDGHSTTIRLIGKESESKIVLDLEELNLVDVEAVRFLGMCETQGVALLNCSAYIRNWIGKERD